MGDKPQNLELVPSFDDYTVNSNIMKICGSKTTLIFINVTVLVCGWHIIYSPAYNLIPI